MLYSGIKAGPIGLKSGLRPKLIVDGWLLKRDVVDALLWAERSVAKFLVASFAVDDIDEACNDKAHGGS